jgi:2-(1,2-epoxy-1,2-dihydrophenyl)acetyl-CoA isomerase
MSQDLIETISGGIATITFNRPESRNSLTPAMMKGLAESLPRLAIDPAVRVVVLTGAGRAFCAGGDVKSFAARAGGAAAAVESFEGRVSDLRARMHFRRSDCRATSEAATSSISWSARPVPARCISPPR